jgi:hypothetical protein
MPEIDFFNGLLIYSPARSAQPGWSGEPGRHIPHIPRVLIRDRIEVDFGLRFAYNVSADAHGGNQRIRRADHADQETQQEGQAAEEGEEARKHQAIDDRALQNGQ